MFSSSLNRRSSFCLSSGATSLGARRQCLCFAISCGVISLGGALVQAAIITTGNVQPPYPVTNPDPWTMGGTLYVAYTSNGSMKITEGSDVSNSNGFLGYWTGATGTVTVTDDGSTWENRGDLSLGRASGGGVGTLTITDYGKVYVGDAASGGPYWSYLNVSDKDSNGTSGGHLYIHGDSTLTSGAAIMGVNSGDYGWATVDGTGSSWIDYSGIIVGEEGVGTLDVRNGGSVSSIEGYLGRFGSGTVTVDGIGSSWAISGDLYVGKYGTGTLTLQNGGSVSCYLGQIGEYGPSAGGTVTVTGMSTWESTGRLLLGSVFGASGTMMIADGGTVYVGDAARSGGTAGWLTVSGSADGILGVFEGSTLSHYGTAVVGNDVGEFGQAAVYESGSSWTNGGDLLIGFRGSGTLTLSYGGSVINGESLSIGLYGSGILNIGYGASVSNTDGRVGHYTGASGTATVDGTDSTWENTGDLLFGRSGGVGSLTISGGGSVYVGDAASGFGLQDVLIVSDSNGSGTNGGHLEIYHGSTVDNQGSFAILGNLTGEYGWATVDGAGTSWTNNGSLFVGFSGSGALSIQGGGSVSNIDGSVGHWGPDSAGAVSVTGSGSTWENTGDLALGRMGGVGTLTISDSGTVYVGDAASSGGRDDCLVVSDADASGSEGGHLYLYNGSTLHHGSYAILGDDVNEHGWATVDGGSSWTNSKSLVVGYSGTGTLSVQDGGTVSNADGWIGFNTVSMGTVTIDGPGSSWTNNGPLAVGFSGSGTLNVQNGGSVSSTDGWIGYWTGATATATVQGTGSSWMNSGGLYIGTQGSGTMAVEGGGEVTTTHVSLGRTGVGPESGTLEIDDGSLDVAGSLVIDQTGRVDFSGGTIRARTIDDPYGKFNWTGGSLEIGTFQGDLDNPSGNLVPGLSPGLARVTGDYIQGADALLEIEIDGPVPTVGYDQVKVGGNVQLDGTLDLLVSHALPLNVGETFVLIDALGDVLGKFESIHGAFQTNTRGVAVTYDTHQVRAIIALLGDANLDGAVDGQDFIIWNANKFSSGNGWSTGDFDGDGTTDGKDFILWNYNKFTSVDTSVPVPEPGVGMLYICLALLTWRGQTAALASQRAPHVRICRSGRSTFV